MNFKHHIIINGDKRFIQHEKRYWKNFAIDMMRLKGTGRWLFRIYEGGKVIKEYETERKDEGIKKTEEIIKNFEEAKE